MLATKGYGLSVDDIDWSSPADMEPYIKAHDAEIKEKDYLSWMSNQYTMHAVSVAVDRCLAGRKARLKYIEEPILESVFKEKMESRYKESKEEVAVFEMKQRINLLRKSGLPESPA